MKTTMYFKTVEEMENYFPDGVPNNILAVIEGEGSNVLFTSTNNTEQGEAVEQGGYITDPADKARIDALEEGKADKSDVYTKTEVDTKIQNVEVDLTGYATETYVTATVQNVVGAAPAALDTLKEIGDALNNDADFAGTMTTALAGKANATDVYSKSEVDAKIAGIDVDFDETDPTVPSYVKNITEANINSWSSKLSTESDPIYSASPAANITSERMAAWDAKVSNVQGDWSEKDSTSGAYIQDKPNISQVTNVDGSYVSIGQSINEHIYPASRSRWNIGAVDNPFNQIIADSFVKPGVGDAFYVIDKMFKQEASRSETPITYSGQVVDYISYLDPASKDYVDDKASFIEATSGKTMGAVDALKQSGILTLNNKNWDINTVSDIAGNQYWDSDNNYFENGYNADNPVENNSPDNSLYDALEYAGVFDWVEVAGDKDEIITYTWINKLASQTYVADYVSTYGGGSQVQADWNVSDSTSNAYIQNKPNITMSNSGIIFNQCISPNNIAQFGFATGNAIGHVGQFGLASGQNINQNGAGGGAIGLILNTSSAGEFACGKSNLSTSNVGFSHGIGDGFSDRKNSIEIHWNGDIYAYGVGNYDGTNATAANSYTISYVINDLQSQMGNVESVLNQILGIS